jgi:transcriptional regulator with XRE-family HTH domain
VQDNFDIQARYIYSITEKGGAGMAESLGDRIRKARERYGMSQAELARRIKISKQAMYQIETNKTPDPGVLKVKAIANALKVSVDYLVGLKDEDSERLAAAVA